MNTCSVYFKLILLYPEYFKAFLTRTWPGEGERAARSIKQGTKAYWAKRYSRLLGWGRGILQTIYDWRDTKGLQGKTSIADFCEPVCFISFLARNMIFLSTAVLFKL